MTAEDSISDNYIKEHPLARSFRVKTIPYYKDLCVIYNDETTKGGAQKTGHDSKFDNTVSVQESCHDVPELLPYSRENMRMEKAEEKSGNEGANMESIHEILIEADYGISLLKRNVNGNDDLQNQSRTYWQPLMDHYLIILC